MVVLGNRGKCAQPCRLPYELLNSKKQSIDKGYLLSPKDLCSLDYIPKFIDAGVCCLKIEGRLKNPEYVATVTRIYRKYIDLYLSGKDFIVDDADRKTLMQVFNRGNFSDGHLNKNDNLIFKDKPNHMGLYLGKIIKYNPSKGYIKLDLQENISIGDCIQVEKENNNYNVSELLLDGKNVKQAFSHSIVEIGRMKGNINIGDKVYKTVDKALQLEANQSYNNEFKKIKLSCAITVKKDLPISLTVSANDGIYKDINFTLNSDIIPVSAINSPITSKRLMEQISKTGNTQFEFSNIDVDLDDNLYVPNISSLNELRRTAISRLEEIAKSSYKKHSALNSIKNLSITTSEKCKTYSLLLNIINPELNYSKLNNVDRLYIPLKYFFNSSLRETLSCICSNNKVYIYLPTIIRNEYGKLINNLNSILDKFKISGFVISHISQIDMVKKYNLELIGNYTLNVFNNYTAQNLKSLGLSMINLSAELDKNSIIELLSNCPIDTELIVYGRIPLMTSNYCLLGTTNKCSSDCKKSCSKDDFYIKDRLGFEFKLLPDNISTVTTILNSKITSISHSDINSSSIRIDVLDESIEEINNIIDTVKTGNRLEGKEYTNGNLNKEI